MFGQIFWNTHPQVNTVCLTAGALFSLPLPDIEIQAWTQRPTLVLMGTFLQCRGARLSPPQGFSYGIQHTVDKMHRIVARVLAGYLQRLVDDYGARGAVTQKLCDPGAN